MRALGNLVKWFGISVMALCVLGFLYQLIGNALDTKNAPPATEMIRLEGHDTHVFCRGSGTRNYLLDAGAGVGAFEWDALIPLLAKTGRVCAFDRPGLGWSDDTDNHHDVAALVRWIAVLVRTAHIPRPFVYVGHSLGADDAILYHERYPQDVSALILLEPAWPRDILAGFHGTRAKAMRIDDCTLSCRALASLGWLGIMRLFVQVEGAREHEPDSRMAQDYRAEVARPALYKTVVATINTLPKSAYEIADVKSFGSAPALILTSSRPRGRKPKETEAQFKAWRRDQLAWFRQLAGMSRYGAGPVTIPASNHSTMVTSAQGAAHVASAIVDFLGSLRRERKVAGPGTLAH